MLYITNFFKTPYNTVADPPHLAIWGFEKIAASVCFFFLPFKSAC